MTKKLGSIFARIALSLFLSTTMTSARGQETHAVFFSFDIPGATDTEATAMTPWGDIVGRYFKPDGSHHGFLLQRGTFSSIDVPGAVLTDVAWINDRGVIVGYYNDGQVNHGFRLSKGRFSTMTETLLEVEAITGPISVAFS
jgi:hypothetical protein